MQRILDYIEQRKKDFAQTDFFEFIQNQAIHPLIRISFAPCMSHYVMSFSDLNRYVFRNLQSEDKLQKIINHHTLEDSRHWPWFLIDLETLGFNHQYQFTQALKLIWNEDTKITRQLAYQIAAHTLNAEPVIKIAAIETLEALGHIFFSASAFLNSEVKAITRKDFLYFGEAHLEMETGHTTGLADVENFLAEIQLTDSQEQEALRVVDQIVNLFVEWTNELLSYAKKYSSYLLNAAKSEIDLMAVN
ncbi:MAG TPA: hypothetical protein VK203_04600 [Nostocaceae cyanobacterium]|nr:hypothetical protein [Nostocaceae cyanobacterium]